MTKPTERVAQLNRRAIVLLYRDEPLVTLEEVGEVFGVSRQYVSQTLSYAGVTIEERDVSHELQTLRGVYKEKTLRELLGLSKAQLWRLTNGQSFESPTTAAKIIDLLSGVNPAQEEL